MMCTTFLEDLSAAGVPPESVDVVLCVHHPTAGRIVRHGEAWRFVVDRPR